MDLEPITTTEGPLTIEVFKEFWATSFRAIAETFGDFSAFMMVWCITRPDTVMLHASDLEEHVWAYAPHLKEALQHKIKSIQWNAIVFGLSAQELVPELMRTPEGQATGEFLTVIPVDKDTKLTDSESRALDAALKEIMRTFSHVMNDGGGYVSMTGGPDSPMSIKHHLGRDAVDGIVDEFRKSVDNTFATYWDEGGDSS